MLCLHDATIVTPLRLRQGSILIEDGRIVDIVDRYEAGADWEIIDCTGYYISPGFIDLHVHGGGGYDVMCGNKDHIIEMCAAHARTGTTSIVPTTFAMPLENQYLAIDTVRAAQAESTDANILGIHLEGPFLSPDQAGAQSPDGLFVPATTDYIPLLDRWPDGIKMVGVAPELDGAMELGRELAARGIVGTIAHSDASFETCMLALENGYTDITHIYSACSTVVRKNSYRTAGVVEAGLYSDDFTTQMIGDLRHLPISLLKLIYRVKGARRAYLISDGLEFTATEPVEGTTYVGSNGLEVIYEDKVMKLSHRQAFAGSCTPLAQMVANLHKEVDIPLTEAVRMASLTPAQRIRVDDRKGMVAVGYDADIVIMDADLNVHLSMVMGKIVYSQL